MKGKIHDLSGSIDEVYDLIDTNQIILHFFYLGTAKLDDHGNPLNFVPPTVLDDATFTVDKIFIKAHILRATLKCVNMEEAIESSEEVKELLELAKANPTHDRLCIVAEESQSLERRNMMLQASRHLVQSVEVSYPGVAGMQSVQILLENGKRQITIQDKNGWFLNIYADDKQSTSVPLSAVNQIQIRLANVPWHRKVSPAEFTCLLTPQGLLVLYVNSIMVIFDFDESLYDVDVANVPGGFRGAVMAVLGGQQGPPQLDSFTLRLSAVHVQLDEIQHTLNALGVESGEE